MNAYEMSVWVIGLICFALTVDTLIKALFKYNEDPPHDCDCEDCTHKTRAEDIE